MEKYRVKNREKMIQRRRLKYPNGRKDSIVASNNRRIRRQKLRFMMDELKRKKGGKCQICGYNTDIRALIWHHRDPQTKEYNVSSLISSANKFDIAIKETEKCDLICANCHTIMEHEY